MFDIFRLRSKTENRVRYSRHSTPREFAVLLRRESLVWLNPLHTGGNEARSHERVVL